MHSRFKNEVLYLCSLLIQFKSIPIQELEVFVGGVPIRRQVGFGAFWELFQIGDGRENQINFASYGLICPHTKELPHNFFMLLCVIIDFNSNSEP